MRASIRTCRHSWQTVACALVALASAMTLPAQSSSAPHTLAKTSPLVLKSEAASQIEKLLSDQKIIVANGNINLRQSPPSGLLKQSGDVVLVVKKGSPLKILNDGKTVSTLFSSQEWLHVQVMGSEANKRPVTGWIYVGKTPNGESYIAQPSAEYLAQEFVKPTSLIRDVTASELKRQNKQQLMLSDIAIK